MLLVKLESTSSFFLRSMRWDCEADGRERMDHDSTPYAFGEISRFPALCEIRNVANEDFVRQHIPSCKGSSSAALQTSLVRFWRNDFGRQLVRSSKLDNACCSGAEGR